MSKINNKTAVKNGNLSNQNAKDVDFKCQKSETSYTNSYTVH